MWYAVYCRDHADSFRLRRQFRAAHLARLVRLQNEGRLLLAGPFPAIDNEEPSEHGFSGSLIVAEFDDLPTAQKWATEDPYRKGKVYKSVEVLPFKKVLP